MQDTDRRSCRAIGRGRDHDEVKRFDGGARGGAALVVSLLIAGCATAGDPGSSTAEASDAEWRALATARPTPLPGAARVSLAEIQLLGDLVWAGGPALSPERGVEELVVAGLLRRRDVHFVERRRFTEAVRAEREGRPRRPGAPPAGVSPGAELLATATWAELGPMTSTLELRLTDATTGRVVTSVRIQGGAETSALPLARSIVDAVTRALTRAGRLPEWEDPLGATGGTTDDIEVSVAALRSFSSGAAAEARWDWESARRWYEAAAAAAGFYEASAALARAARLRTGGTLGES